MAYAQVGYSGFQLIIFQMAKKKRSWIMFACA